MADAELVEYLRKRKAEERVGFEKQRSALEKALKISAPTKEAFATEFNQRVMEPEPVAEPAKPPAPTQKERLRNKLSVEVPMSGPQVEKFDPAAEDIAAARAREEQRMGPLANRRMVEGGQTGGIVELALSGNPAEVADRNQRSIDDISTAGGSEPAGPGFAPPRVVNTPGFMSPDKESVAFSREGAPAEAQAEFRANSEDALGRKNLAGAHGMVEEKKNADQVATIQGQQQEYLQEQQKQQLEVISRQEALAQRHEELMANLEKEISSIPDAPRTIREKLEKSGVGDKIVFGFAAAFSVLGSGRNGGQSSERFLSTVNANINALVQKEKDEYERLGEKVKRTDSVYEKAYKALGDKSAALAVTKNLYMEAADAALKEQSARYQGALAGPKLEMQMAAWNEEMAKGQLDASGKVKQASEKTMKYVPPTQRVVYDPRDPNGWMANLSKEDKAALVPYRKYLDDRGEPSLASAKRALTNAIRLMPDGFDMKLFIQQGYPESMLAKAVAGLSSEESSAVQQQVQSASNEVSRAMAGLSRTRPEVAANFLQQQLFTKAAATRTLHDIDTNINTIHKEADAAFPLSKGGSVGDLYRARLGQQ